MPDTAYTCSRCGTTKPVTEFYTDRAKASGHQSHCKACESVRRKAHYIRNRERTLERNREWRKKNPKPKQRTSCARCGDHFIRDRRHPHQYCSKACSAASHQDRERARERKRAPRPPRSRQLVCLNCGKTFKHRGGPARYCSDQCRQAARPPKAPPTCPIYHRSCRTCERSFMARRRNKRCCSKKCSDLWQRHGIASREPATCIECGNQWLRWDHSNGHTRYCSDQCMTTGSQRRKCEARHRAKARRRAKLRGVRTEPVSLATVAKRDGWRCHICKRKVTRKTWSLDHLVPISHGGDHTYANTSLAHHRCNSLRSNTGPAQLLLASL